MATAALLRNCYSHVSAIHSNHQIWVQATEQHNGVLYSITVKIPFFWKVIKNAKKQSPSHIVLSQCSKNYPCSFYLVLDSKNGSLGLLRGLGSHFRNLKTLEKSKIILGQFFFTPREDNAWRKVPFLLPSKNWADFEKFCDFSKIFPQDKFHCFGIAWGLNNSFLMIMPIH